MASPTHSPRRATLTATFRLIVVVTLLLVIACVAAAEMFVPADRLVATRAVRFLAALPVPTVLVGILVFLAIPRHARRENERPPLEAGRHIRQMAIACATIAVIAVGPYTISLVGFRPNPLALLLVVLVPFAVSCALLLSQSRTVSSRGFRDSPRCANCHHPIRGSIFSPCPECGWTGRSPE